MKTENEDQEFAHLPSFDNGKSENEVRHRRWMRSHGETELEYNGNQVAPHVAANRSEPSRNTR